MVVTVQPFVGFISSKIKNSEVYISDVILIISQKYVYIHRINELKTF